ncbi:MAG: response regulator [Calditrichaeota bacterium]|nr:MAG: response regulator [Calditrichota bacterium]
MTIKECVKPCRIFLRNREKQKMVRRHSDNNFVLVVDDDVSQLITLEDILKDEKLEPICCKSAQEALKAMDSYDINVAILDLRLPDDNGLELLKKLKKKNPQLRAIINTAFATLDSAMTAVNEEAFAFVKKMGDVRDLLSYVHRAFHHHLTQYSVALEMDVSQRTAELSSINKTLRKEIAVRKKAEKDVRESQNKLRTLIETVPLGVFECDTAGAITQSNSTLSQITGFGKDEILQMHICDFFVPDLAKETHSQFLKKLITEQPEPQPYLAQIQKKDGLVVEIQVDWTYKRDENAQLLGCVCALSDISERKQLEDQLRHAQKMETIGTLAGGIAHDFNNVLVPIIGYTELAMKQLENESEAKYDLSQVINAAERARELVQQILLFSYKGDQVNKPVFVHVILKEALKFLKASIPSTIEIREFIDVQCSKVTADPTQIHQVFTNLCVNGCAAMQETGGILEVHLDEIELNETDVKFVKHLEPGLHVRLRVKDSGIGIEKENINRIFDPFFTTREVGEGTGLGLAVVQGIVTSHKGRITVESEPGQGSTFTVFLPIAKPESAQENTNNVKLKDNSDLYRGKENVLIVDDEISVINILQRMLEHLGYQVTSFSDSLKAIDAFRQRPNNFDIIITDQTMPKLTGIELVKKAHKIRSGIPIILTTGYSEKVTPDTIAQFGVQALLKKPFELSDVGETIRHVLQ